MPELPEVETVVRQLNSLISKREISEVKVNFAKIVKNELEDFLSFLVGKKVLRVYRRAKLIIWEFEDGVLVSHLKMTGKWLTEKILPQKHIHLEIIFSDGEELYWSDVRKFGYLEWLNFDELNQKLEKYGPEPLENELEDLIKVFEKPKGRKVKAALLKQEVIAGVGNIYADEACFASGILPTRELGSLKLKEKRSLLIELRRILEKSIEQGGTTANNYMSVDGSKGEFVNFLKVYGRKGEKCFNCEGEIEKIVLVGRGTHFCRNCQK